VEMKKYTLSLAVAFLFCVAATVSQAQGTMGSPQGSTPRSQGMGQPQQQPGQNDPMGSQDQTGNNSTTNKDSGEHKLKGCVQSQGGQYVLETKKGKMVALTGQDVSAHVGHEVQVKGTWASGNMSQSSTGNTGEKTLNVTDVKMISDTCGGKGKEHGSSMGTGANGTKPNGSGTSNPANTGSSGTGTQPPQ
jgi:hypothetical protein